MVVSSLPPVRAAVTLMHSGQAANAQSALLHVSTVVSLMQTCALAHVLRGTLGSGVLIMSRSNGNVRSHPPAPRCNFRGRSPITTQAASSLELFRLARRLVYRIRMFLSTQHLGLRVSKLGSAHTFLAIPEAGSMFLRILLVQMNSVHHVGRRSSNCQHYTIRIVSRVVIGPTLPSL